jgi:hypothetical protein
VLIAEIKRAHVSGALITAAGGRQQMVMVAGAGYARTYAALSAQAVVVSLR